MEPLTNQDLSEQYLSDDQLSCSQDEEYRPISSRSKKIRKTAVKKSHKTPKNQQKQTRTSWKTSEDRQVLDLIAQYGTKWTKIGKIIGGRTGKQVRDRYLYTLKPDINKSKWTEEEDALLLSLHAQLGNKWLQIAPSLPGRSENQVKNRFNAICRKVASAKNSNSDSPKASSSITQDAQSPHSPVITQETFAEESDFTRDSTNEDPLSPIISLEGCAEFEQSCQHIFDMSPIADLETFSRNDWFLNLKKEMVLPIDNQEIEIFHYPMTDDPSYGAPQRFGSFFSLHCARPKVFSNS